MNGSLNDFGNTAIGLAKNPLGIIALFIVLIYGFASLVVGFSDKLYEKERVPLIWFLVLFPVAVLIVFGWLVSKHHTKLYGPGDYKDEKHFVDVLNNPNLKKLSLADPSGIVETEIESPEIADISPSISDVMSKERTNIYKNNRGYFLVHVLQPSNKVGQEYDIYIYLKKHKSDDHSDVERAEFFFGSYWGNKIFTGKKVGNFIGVRTSAYGPFLCTCRLTFQDGTTVSLHRYIDFEMGEALKKAINI